MKKLAKLFTLSMIALLFVFSLSCAQAETILDKAEDIVENTEGLKDKADDIKEKAEDLVSAITSDPNTTSPDTTSPDTSNPGTSTMDISSWIKVNTGEWEQTAGGIKVYGAGYREGHQGLQSKDKYNFNGSETRIKWMANGGGGTFSAFWVLLISGYVPETAENSGILRGGYFTTDHSWKESVVIDVDTWYYTHITVTPDSQFTAITTKNGYDDGGGEIVYEGTGEYENAENGSIVVVFQDNYGGLDTYVVVGEVITDAGAPGTTVASQPPPTTPPPAVGPGGEIELGHYPTAVTYDGTNIWVTTKGADGGLHKLNGTTGELLATYEVGMSSADVLYDGTNIWVVNQGDNNVVKVNPGDGSIIGTYPVGEYPSAIEYDGENIWVANQKGGTLTKLSASDGANLLTYTLPGGSKIPKELAFDGENLWVGCHWGYLMRLRVSDAAIQPSFSTGGYVSGLAFDGESVRTVIWSDVSKTPMVRKYSVTDWIWLGNYDLHQINHPSALYYDGASFWVADSNEDKIIKLPAGYPSVGDTVPFSMTDDEVIYQTGPGPSDMVYANGYMWVTNERGNTISMIPLVFGK